MDRNTIIGFVLIALVLMVWMSMNAPPPQPALTAADSAAVKHKMADSIRQAAVVAPQAAVAAPVDTLGKYFTQLSAGEKKTLTIETGLYRAVLTTKGGGIRTWELKRFLTWDQHPVNFLDPAEGGDFSLLFYSGDGKVINTKNLTFTSSFAQDQTVTLAEHDSAVVEYTRTILGA